MLKRKYDVLYLEGAGDLVSVLKLWGHESELLSETSITYSSQTFDFCNRHQLKTLAFSHYKEKKELTINNITARSIPRKSFSGSIGYHLSQFAYGIQLLMMGLKNRPRYIHIPSGLTYLFILSPLKLFNVKIIARFHNTLWPSGFFPESKVHRLLLKLDAWFLKHVASSAMCVSEEISRQINEITKEKNCPVHVFIPQFNQSSFTPTQPPELNPNKPFNIVFAGRVEHSKGIFDILEMAKQLKGENVNFHLCGGGSDLESLKEAHKLSKLGTAVTIHGPLKRPELIEVYQKAHVVIIPTRSTFAEGYAKVAAEAVLLNRPIITSRVVPAIHPLKSAALEAITDDIGSYVDTIKLIKNDPKQYQLLCKACTSLQSQFFNIKSGMGYVMEKTL